jgi:hypothetical protein
MRPWSLIFFKNNNLCVFTSCAKDEVGKSSGTVLKIFEGRDMISKGIEQNHDFVM